MSIVVVMQRLVIALICLHGMDLQINNEPHMQKGSPIYVDVLCCFLNHLE